MQSPEQQQEAARVAIRYFLRDIDCKNIDELVPALTVLMSRAAFVIERKTNSDTAQLALYEPYLVLCNRGEK